MVFCPCPDLAAAPAAGRSAVGSAGRSPANCASVADEGSELFAQGAGVLSAQVDLIIRAREREPHGLVGRAAIEVVFQRDGHFPGHLDLPCTRWGACTLPCSHHPRLTGLAFSDSPAAPPWAAAD